MASLTTKIYKPIQDVIVHLVRVSRPGGSPPATNDAAALMSYLNNTIFNQAVLSVTVDTYPNLTVDYDVSGEDKDKRNGLDRPTQSNGGVETGSIIAAQLAEVPGVQTREYFVFIVDRIRDLGDGALGSVSGFQWNDSGQHAWMFVTGAHCPFAVAHELGHCLGLGDLDRPHQPSMDPENLMAYSSLGDNRRLRVGQWDTLRPSQP